ncbi:hypothetical protein PCASD_26718 [Puccinia coronata f. sp. avenae]|uniref:Uncharacterized protein n=1 Tax=Puccinia coronata f. sp. avenae TaxID=200324 RepID=A0A2N5TLN0_9BASI|nr:hypothetical protein PCASD_26718 [Puccinia coronata f. sp. avenae]
MWQFTYPSTYRIIWLSAPTFIATPSGTLIRVLLGTPIRAPRGSSKPLGSRGLREPGRTGVPAVHACPAGPHAEPAVLTPLICFWGGVRTPFGRAAIKTPPAFQVGETVALPGSALLPTKC